MKNSKKWISLRLGVQNPEALSNNLQLIAAPPELVPPLTEQPGTESIPMHFQACRRKVLPLLCNYQAGPILVGSSLWQSVLVLPGSKSI